MKLDIHPGINHPEHVIRTHAGMAHFATTGPDGTWCSECALFIRRRCAKYEQLAGRQGKVFPAETPSCKYFEPKGKTHEPR